LAKEDDQCDDDMAEVDDGRHEGKKDIGNEPRIPTTGIEKIPCLL
jgi:hypothetical protein